MHKSRIENYQSNGELLVISTVLCQKGLSDISSFLQEIQKR